MSIEWKEQAAELVELLALERGPVAVTYTNEQLDTGGQGTGLRRTEGRGREGQAHSDRRSDPWMPGWIMALRPHSTSAREGA
jgi:hypothetical protein